ncbi:MAG: T9SS type A sorting domain-containing protein [Bacteroidetes bacterium]|nr:T9SS type A sorting domain-containing protein [Bacteroidota bacterium]
MMKKNIVIHILFLGFAMGQTIEFGNTVFNSGGSGETGTLNTNETHRYQHTVSVGAPLIGTTSDGGNFATTFGQFSFYNLPTSLFTVSASAGDYPDRVKVSWGVDDLGAPFQDGVKVYRNGDLLTEFHTSEDTVWTDMNVIPGEIYIYKVVPRNHYGDGVADSADGFVNPNGKITGNVKTTTHQTPVVGVEVSLDPYFGKTLEFDGENDYISIVESLSDSISGKDAITIEYWFKGSEFQSAFSVQEPDGGHIISGAGSPPMHSISTDGAGISAGAESIIEDGNWHHIAMTWERNTANGFRSYLDTVLVDQRNSADVALPIFDDVIATLGSLQGSSEFLNGHLDEIRIWSVARDSVDIMANMHRVVGKDSPNLLAEWRFDEGQGSKVFDITDASHDGEINGATWSDDNPDIHNSGFTDMDGNYSIESIYYEPGGTTFLVTPTKPYHVFQPTNKQVTLSTSATTADGQNFQDNSQIDVSGYINFSNTECYVESVEIKEKIVNDDGSIDTVSFQPPVFTDSEGHYVCEFEPSSSHHLIPILGEHTFYPMFYETGAISIPQGEVNFADNQTYSLSGNVTGGDCELPLGGTFNVHISTTSGCYSEIVETSPNGSYTFENLPAQHFEVSVTPVDNNPEYDFTGQQANLVHGNDTVKFTHRNELQVELSDLPTSCGNFDHVVVQGEVDSVFLSAYEIYNGEKCYLDSIHGSVVDNITDHSYTEDVVLPENGSISISYTAKEPNLLDGGAHPYQKNLEVTVIDKYGRQGTTEFWAVIKGAKIIPENNFTTTTSTYPWFVLRNPPGDGSSTFFGESNTTCNTLKIYSQSDIGNENNSTLHLGRNSKITFGFFGFSTELDISVTDDIGMGWKKHTSKTDSYEQTSCFTRDQTFSTSADGLTGDDATVFVGGGLTMTFSLARDLKLENCEVNIDTILTTDVHGTHSTYMHSKYYIRTFLLDNLLNQWADTNDSTYLFSYEKWVEILQKDSIAVVNAIDDAVIQIGTVVSYSTIDFDAGASLQYSNMTNTDRSTTHEIKINNSDQEFNEFGITVNGQGFKRAYTHSTSTEKDTITTGSSSKTQTIGFHLDDNDPGDAFSVSVLKDTIWGSTVFKVNGGQSSCPWEPNTVKREQVQLSMDSQSAINIHPTEQAVFTVNLGNTSETGETQTYDLSLINSSNPNGAILKIGDQTMGSTVFSYSIPAGEVQTLTLTVERGPIEFKYDSLQVMLSSQCDGNINAIVAFSVHFIEPCGGNLAITNPGDGWVGIDDSTMSFTVSGYNRADTTMPFLYMEYQHFDEDTWFVVDTIYMDSLDADYFTWEWDVSFMEDGGYNIRAVGECTDGLDNESAAVAGFLDRKGPEVFGGIEPIDGILNVDDELKIIFDEAINCDLIYPNRVSLKNKSYAMDLDVSWSCENNEIVFIPEVQNRFIENSILELTLYNIYDMNGNSTDSIQYEFTVDRNPIHWNQNELSAVVMMGEDKSVSTTLRNPGTVASDFSFTGQPWYVEQQNTPLPWWISVNPTQGDLNPGGEFPIDISISGMLNAGEHKETFFANTPEGDEPLTLSVRSLCQPPVWDLDVTSYQYSMSINTQISVENEVSKDEYDFIGAFVNDEVRGVAPIERVLYLSAPYDSTWANEQGDSITHTFVDTLLDKYMGFLTIGSNTQNGEEVDFRIWDASDCEEYWVTAQSMTFSSNSVVGSPLSPHIINTNRTVAEFLTLEEGWNWFSVHLEQNDATIGINDIFSHEDHFTSGERIINQNEFETYSEATSEWLPGIMIFDPTQMYMAHIDTITPVTLIGEEINPDSLTFTLQPNWNWFGYPLRYNHTINEALENLPASDGSVIKSERQFAEYLASIDIWVGSLVWMTPGDGYLFESTADTTISFTYSGLGAEQGGGMARMIATIEPEIIDSPWNFNAKKFQYNMPFTGTLDDGKWTMENIVIAAIINDKVRGIAKPVFDPVLEEWRIYLMVYSNRKIGETIQFRIFDSEESIEYFANEISTFNESGKVGSVLNPFPLTKASLVIPEEYSLSQNYPNPFNPVTTIQFGVPEESKVRLLIYDLLGREVRTLVNGNLKPGFHKVIWNGTDTFGKQVATGMYFTVMQSGNFRDVRKMVLLK